MATDLVRSSPGEPCLAASKLRYATSAIIGPAHAADTGRCARRDLAYECGSEDNITIMLLTFPVPQTAGTVGAPSAECRARPRRSSDATSGPTDADAATEAGSAAPPMPAPVAAMQDYAFVRELSHDALGRVVLAKRDADLYAVRVLVKTRIAAQDMIGVRSLLRIRHPSLVAYYGLHESAQYAYLITEFVDGEPFAVRRLSRRERVGSSPRLRRRA